MKQLTQAVFEGMPDWVKSAVIDEDGTAWFHSKMKSQLIAIPADGDYLGCHDAPVRPPDYDKTEYIGAGYDTTNWQNSAIDREFAV